MQEFPESLRALLGREFDAFVQSLSELPALALRLNPNRPAAQVVARPFLGEPVPWAEHGYYLLPNARPGASIAHAAGAFYLQEASAMLPAAALDAQPGESVLDLCAAPGGKALQLAAAMQGRGLLVANEKEPSRARALFGNLERLGICNAVVTNLPAQALCAKWPGRFDAVLADAPCSGEGMFRRDPGARNEWSPEAPAGCQRRQLDILDAAARAVRPGGRMVYSTCTFNATENEEVVAEFLQAHPEFSPVEFCLPGIGASRGGMLRLWPHRARGDGHFVAKFRRTDRARPSDSVRPPDRARPTGGLRPKEGVPTRPGECQTALEALCALAVDTLPEIAQTGELFFQGGRLFAAPPGTAGLLPGVRAISPGLALLRAEKNRVEPDHALAMALPPDGAKRRAELSEADAVRYLRGETLSRTGEDGWTLVTHRTLPLGWGKQTAGVLKNHLPKGLRRNIASFSDK